uniref:Carbohydrate sulfotransferase n=1 Tax=Cynoglossus semilaevis TaxID=244447 RepID=A0A3P8WET2_CYNSE
RKHILIFFNLIKLCDYFIIYNIYFYYHKSGHCASFCHGSPTSVCAVIWTFHFQFSHNVLLVSMGHICKLILKSFFIFFYQQCYQLIVKRYILFLPEMRMDLVQEERKQLIREVCHGDKEALLEKEIGYNKYHHLIVDNAHGIIYCFVPKVACTNLKKFMLILKKGEPYGDPGNVTEDVHTSGAITFLSSLPKHEIAVINPFVRLISAYRNKFEHINDFFYPTYARNILRLYGNYSNPPQTAREATALGVRPSFKNFIQYLVDSKTEERSPFDEHWRQMYRLCYPCAIEFDFIGHQETLQEDAEHLLRILKLQKDIRFPHSYVNMTSPDSVENWFGTVSLEDRKTLYKIYETDFKLFGYKKPEELLRN